ncbi:hypothetical protein CMI40_02085 [Candidatus Pacearchaeota archaeon]|jgi:hypothetical protein|nr:hypothetical protein [Candidatus Pacearchaeota archaeon]|tara:strand:- start:3133 stop:3567 length:435 start_codon:yes stop_codon:yes gene_type:complete
MKSHLDFKLFTRPTGEKLKHKNLVDQYLEDRIFDYKGKKYIIMFCAESVSKKIKPTDIYTIVPGAIYGKEKNIEDKIISNGVRVIPIKREKKRNITIFLNKKYGGYEISKTIIIPKTFKVNFWPRTKQNHSFEQKNLTLQTQSL